MKTYHLPIVIERDEDGYYVSCPELQGCYSQGESYEEAMENIKDAIKLHLEDRRDQKEDLPRDKSVSISIVEVGL